MQEFAVTQGGKSGGRPAPGSRGVSAQFRPLDIDHAIPKAHARQGFDTFNGERIPVDDDRNLQVLCALRNGGKRGTSTYGFRCPSTERFTETISLALHAARDVGYSRDQVLAAAFQQFTSPPQSTDLGQEQ